MTGADSLVKSLEREGAEIVFGYPGVTICPFFDSLLNTKIRTVLVRSEQNAAHMASGYARTLGKVGVCAVTSGPGATNVITGIATAFADSIPLVVLTGQVKSDLIGSDVFQEADITGAAESFVKYSYLVKDAADIPRIVKEAFYIANSGRRGPVLIDLPIDVQTAAIAKYREAGEVSLRTYKPTVQGNIVQIKKVLKELSKAKRPILCVGGGVLLSGAKKPVREFAERYNIPVVSTMMGIGVMPTAHPLYFGMVGNYGKPYANKAMNKADLLLVVGARLADRAISQPDLIMEDKALVHIDVDPAEIGKNAGATVPLVGDVKHIFEELAALDKKEEASIDFSDWVETMEVYRDGMEKSAAAGKRAGAEKAGALAAKRADVGANTEEFVSPAEFIRCLSDLVKNDAIYVADVGQNQIWSCDHYAVRDGLFLTSGGMGTMGYALPAAIGAKLADKERQVLAVCGDGAFQMAMPELATMTQYRVPVKLVVFRNNALGMVREYQKRAYKERYTMIELSGAPDVAKIAEAYGLPFFRLTARSRYVEELNAFLKEDTAAIMEVCVDPEASAKL